MIALNPKRLTPRAAIPVITLVLLLFSVIGSFAQPVIRAIAPVSGPAGTAVTITGSGFSTVPADNIVYFGGVKASVTSAGAGAVVAQAPAGAGLQPLTVTVNGLTATSPRSFGITFSGTKVFNAGSFGDLKVFSAGTSPSCTVVADWDGDGKPDVAVMERDNNSVGIFRNMSKVGSVAMSPRIALPLSGSASTMATADLDGDGRQDLVVVYGLSIEVFRNTSTVGTPSFVLAKTIPMGFLAQYANIGDVDGDGKPDLVIGCYSDISVFLNTSAQGSISFAAKAGFGSGADEVAIGDMDGDGKPDLTLIHGNVSIWKNNCTRGQVSFIQKGAFAASGTASCVRICDLDGDGKQDVIAGVGSSGLDGGICVWRNITSGTDTVMLSDRMDYTGISAPISIYTGDLNGDGKPDLAAKNDAVGGITVFRNTSSTGAISLTKEASYNGGSHPFAVTAGDIDGDGRQDLVAANILSPYSAGILRNMGTGASISNVTPIYGGLGTVVTIVGDGFDNVTAVNFGGTKAASFTVVSHDTIRAIVGVGASGAISVETPDGEYKYTYVGFTYTYRPVITSITPSSGTTGTQVTITGSNFMRFTPLATVTFGNVPAKSVSVQSPYTIVAVVGNGGVGKVVVATEGGADTSNAFTYKPPAPVISSVVPNGGKEGTVVTIAGTNFTTASAVWLGSVKAQSFTVNSATSITAVIGASGSGTTKVTTDGGTATLAGFVFDTVAKMPSITSATSIGQTGQVITISGTNFLSTTAVSLGGVAVKSFRVLDANTIEAVVGSGASGTISVTNAVGTANSDQQFLWYAPGPPVLSSISPKSAQAGTLITLSGKNLMSVKSVSFGGIPAASFTTGSTAISAVVGVGGNTGDVTVVSDSGSSSLGTFTFLPATAALPPVIAAFVPTRVEVGGKITITGENFTGATAVLFGGVPASSFTVVSATVITATVGAGISGDLSVITPGGEVSVPGFISYAPDAAPVISSVTPLSARTGQTVTVKGTGFKGATAISFGGINASAFTIKDSVTIEVVMGTSATGDVVVRTASGYGTFSGYKALPAVTAFSPAVASIGETITIEGDNLNDVTGVRFGGSATTSFNVISPSRITAVLQRGTAGTVPVVVTTPAGSDSAKGLIIRPPVITSFSPVIAGKGTTIGIYGNDLLHATAVSIGGVAVKSFTVINASYITAVLDTAVSGKVRVVTTYGASEMDGFTYIKQPSIVSVTPASGPAGTLVTITGTNFSPVPDSNIVRFGVVRATVQSATATSLTVVAPATATMGAITVTTTHYTCYYYHPFVVTFAGAAAFADSSFAAPVSIGTGAGVLTMSLTDMDDDKKADIMFTARPSSNSNLDADNIKVLTNQGTMAAPAFRASGSFNTAYGALQLAAGDMDGDGRLDVAAASHGDDYGASAARNLTVNGQVLLDTFRFAKSGGLDKHTIAVDDFNGDGKPDMAMLSYYGRLALATNTSTNGILTFDAAAYYSTPIGSVGVSSGDIDGDGKPDIVVNYVTNVSSSQSGITFWRNTTVNGGVVSFASPVALNGKQYPAGAILGDLDGDGRPELIVNYYATYIKTITIYKNNSTPGNIVWGAPVDIVGMDSPAGWALSDLNGDGKPELVVSCSATNKVGVYKNISADTVGLAPKIEYAVGTSTGQMIVTDFNGDGKPDICISNTRDSLVVLLNQINRTQAPQISSFAPMAAHEGDTVLVHGTGLSAATSVTLGGKPAASFSVSGDTLVQVIVGRAATGVLAVTTPAGTAVKDSFTFIQHVPVINAIAPATAGTGEQIIIHGKYFTGADSVSLGGVSVSSITVLSDTTVAVITGTGATGKVIVGTAAGTASFDAFTYKMPAPAIQAFEPAAAASGTIVKITGAYFRNATAVSLGGVAATGYTILSDSAIIATVGTGATGVVKVSSAAGVDSMIGFTFLPPAPVLRSVSPDNGTSGTLITIKGQYLKNAVAVTVGGIALSYQVVADTLIQATIKDGASGTVMVTTASGSAFLDGFTYIASSSVKLYSFSPAKAVKGATVILYGSGMLHAGTVSFGGVPAAAYTILSDSTIVAALGEGASGNVMVKSGQDSAVLGGFVYQLKMPVISGFYPVSGVKGTDISIIGSNLTAATQVTIGGVAADAVTVISDTLIRLKAGNGNTGAVAVTTNAGSVSGGTFTFVLPQPVISSFSPDSAASGTTVTIKGTGFTGASIVSFGGGRAASFAVVSDSVIRAVVDNGFSGNIVVSTSGGSAIKGGFKYIAAPPVIYSFTPAKAQPNDIVTIKGKSFTGTTAVTFGGVAAYNVNVTNDSTITAFVTSGSVSGNVVVTTPAGSASLSGFVYVPYAPSMWSFTPATGGTGTKVTISGSSLENATSVTFGGVPASSFYMQSAYAMVAVVGAGASGNIVIVTSAGKDSLTGFKYDASLNIPVVSSFSPAVAAQSAVVTIRGLSFTKATGVYFGGVKAVSYTIVSDSVITATVGAGASGSVSVVATKDTASLAGFTYTGVAVKTAIYSFSPTTATAGTLVTINGTAFTGASAVYFGGVRAAAFTVVSDSVIAAQVASGASGLVSVITGKDTISLAGFTYTMPAPIVTSFSPVSGSTGTVVTIHGLYLSGVTTVSFGGVAAASLQLVNDSLVKATVGSGATGDVFVAAGSAASAKSGFTYIPAVSTPAIYSFSPLSATTDAQVTIYGTSFSGASAVYFGGVRAAAFTVVSDSVVTARVASGASGKVSVVIGQDTISLAGFTYITPTPVSTPLSVLFFNPVSARRNQQVTIVGHNFTNITSVSFGGVSALQYNVVNDSVITAVVGAGASGDVMVARADTSVSMPGFTYVIPAPQIDSFTPTTAGKGATVTIKGLYFTGTTAVSFGGVPASSFAVIADSIITATAGEGASGQVSVTTPGGTAVAGNFVYADVVSTISLYPNPTTGTVWVKHELATGAKIIVTNMSGAVVRTIAVPDNEAQTAVSLTGLPSGMYQITWTVGATRKTQTLLLQ